MKVKGFHFVTDRVKCQAFEGCPQLSTVCVHLVAGKGLAFLYLCPVHLRVKFPEINILEGEK